MQPERRRTRGAGLRGMGLALALTLIGVSAARAQRAVRATDPLQTISRWTDEYRRHGAQLDVQRDTVLAPALKELRGRFGGIDAGENEALIALCDLASIAGIGSEDWVEKGTYLANERETEVREAAMEVLRAALDAPCGVGRGQFLATEVLGAPREHPLPRRIAVAEALVERHWDVTLLPLLASAEAPERGLREAAVKALAGWKSAAVDSYLARLTVRSLKEPDFLTPAILLKHFHAVSLPPDSPAAAEVAKALAKATVSHDWREAIRRIPLSRALSNDQAVPPLIEALGLWCGRGAAGGTSRRVEAALVHELELRSGKQLGHSPERWAFWWKQKRAAPPSKAPAGSSPDHGTGQTKADFFGLRPMTDRIVFVIDRSGSMAEGFGTRDSSRYAEAIRQMAQFLEQLGPRTRFDVILFSDQAHRWSGTLRPATPVLIEAAVQWARRNPPRGGTFLQPAIADALWLDARTGQPNLERLEADTVIVLCDGATTEGSAWVTPLMLAVGEATCVRFDCVQIGKTGNGTLELLAKCSGGQFVCVDS